MGMGCCKSRHSAAVAPGEQSPPVLPFAEGEELEEDSEEELAADVMDSSNQSLTLEKTRNVAEALVKWKMSSALRIFRLVSDPPPLVEIAVKICLAALLYGLMITLTTQMLISAFARDSERDPQIIASDTSGIPYVLRVKATACMMMVSIVPGSSEVKMTETSFLTDSWASYESVVKLEDTGSCYVATCAGPVMVEGYQIAALLEVGSEVPIASTEILIESSSRSSLVLTGTNYGSSLDVKGVNMVAQLEGVEVQFLKMVLRMGFLDIRKSIIASANLDVGSASVSILVQDATAVELYRSTDVEADTAASSLCLSDIQQTPELKFNATTNASYFYLGSGSTNNVSSVFRVIRGEGGAGVGQFFASNSVTQENRSSVNTYDTTSNVGFVVEASFNSWATKMYYAGFHLLRARVLGPGFDNDIGGITARGEWMYSLFGDVYIWHPLSVFWIMTVGIFAPMTARTDVVLSSVRCKPRINVVVSEDVCYPENSTQRYDVEALGGSHAALLGGLPSELVRGNASVASVYFVESPTKLGFLMSLSDGIVSVFARSDVPGSNSVHLLTANASRATFMNTSAVVFYCLSMILLAMVPSAGLIVVIRVYMAERDRIIAAEGKRLWPVLWNSQQKRAEKKREKSRRLLAEKRAETEYWWKDLFQFDPTSARRVIDEKAHRLISNSTFFLTLLEAVILRRTPKQYVVDGLPNACYVVCVQFAMIQMLFFPLYTFASLQLFDGIERQTGCGSLDMLRHVCYRRVHAPLIITIILLLTLQVFMITYTIIEYLARQIDQVVFIKGKRRPGFISRHRRRLLRIRSDPVFQWTFIVLMVSLLFCSLFLSLAFVMYIILGTCVAPQRLIPALFGIAAVIIVFRQTSMALTKVRDTIQAKLKKIAGGTKSALASTGDLKAAVDETLTDAGLNEAQIFLFTIFTCVALTVFLVFIVLGTSLFVSVESIVPTLVSSGLMTASAVGTLRSGQVDEDSTQYQQLTDSFTNQLKTVQDNASKVSDALNKAEEDVKKSIEAVAGKSAEADTAGA